MHHKTGDGIPNAFLVIKSNKVGLDSAEGYVIVRNGFSFLRVLGGEPSWNVMTATASEDHGRIQVCPDQRRLVESALRLCAKLGAIPRVEKDRLGREYVKIGTITRESGESDEDFDSENEALLCRFFEVFDNYKDLNSRGLDEIRELYEALKTDDQGSDVYLSDGVWLSRDGSIQDRGR